MKKREGATLITLLKESMIDQVKRAKALLQYTCSLESYEQ